MSSFRKAIGFALIALGLTSASLADDPLTPDRVEEDWALVIASPDPDVTCPQILTSMKADTVEGSPVLGFTLNYRDVPSFSAGGLQVRILDGDQALASDEQGSDQLQTVNEVITWTQRLKLSGSTLTFKILAGRSQTWGDFGTGDDDLLVSGTTSAASLSGYDPDFSVRNSGPSFGSNRVTRMTLLAIRTYRGDTLLSTDLTPRPVAISN